MSIPKFKAWNVEEKIMHDVAFPSWNGKIEVWKNNRPQTEVQYLSNGPAEEGILLQDTGLKDKNGKEVFQGHIVSCSSGCPHEVQWMHKVPSSGLGGMPGFYLLGLREGYVWTGYEEIIGNIFENPELIKS